MPATAKAPGLVWRKRRDGTPIAYWVARRSLVAAGYRPKTVRLHYADELALAARCHVLQAEMLQWAVERGRAPLPNFDGTFASLFRLYETHPDSPYHDLEEPTRRPYSSVLRRIAKYKGDRTIAAVTGIDVVRWYKEFVDSTSRTSAHFTINVLKAVLSFGSTLRIHECRILREELRSARFEAGQRRTEQMTYRQVVMFRDKAREMNKAWMGRCVVLQFDFGMRRRDVIGTYRTAPLGTDGIRLGRRIWKDGLIWADIDADGIVRRVVSKTRKKSAATAVHCVHDYPNVEEELARTPTEQRIGPLVINDRTGVPPTEEQCRRYFRVIARASGIPDDVQMMDIRAGANTETYEAGVSSEDAMALLTHTEEATNRRYLREVTEQSRRAAKLRVASRKE